MDPDVEQGDRNRHPLEDLHEQVSDRCPGSVFLSRLSEQFDGA
jgi:hypothetical protein